jgi:small subunit ribosomal protein S1
LSEVQVGSLVKGRVRSILPYGAFVDIGTVTDGLLHVSQISLEYVRDISSMMKVGDEINVRVIAVDMDKKEFSLSLLPEGAEQERMEMAMAARERRRTQVETEVPTQGVSVARRNESRRQQMLKEAVSLLSDDGSETSESEVTATTTDAAAAPKEDMVPGAKRDAAQKRDSLKKWYDSTPAARDPKIFTTGKVVSIEDYGAFVSVGAPTDGLVHISEISKEHVTKVTDRLNVGEEVQVRIIAVDLRRGRISLSMKPYEARQSKSSGSAEKRSFPQPAFKTTMELAFERVRDQLVAAGLMK